jgi:hypothetical protein
VLKYQGRETTVQVYFIKLNAKLPTVYYPQDYCAQNLRRGRKPPLSVKCNEKKLIFQLHKTL